MRAVRHISFYPSGDLLWTPHSIPFPNCAKHPLSLSSSNNVLHRILMAFHLWDFVCGWWRCTIVGGWWASWCVQGFLWECVGYNSALLCFSPINHFGWNFPLAPPLLTQFPIKRPVTSESRVCWTAHISEGVLLEHINRCKGCIYTIAQWLGQFGTVGARYVQYILWKKRRTLCVCSYIGIILCTVFDEGMFKVCVCVFVGLHRCLCICESERNCGELSLDGLNIYNWWLPKR